MAEIQKHLDTLKTEQRSVFTNEERTAVNDLKLKVQEIDEQIALEKEIAEKRNAKLDSIANSTPSIISSGDLVSRVNSEFSKFLKGESFDSAFQRNGNFLIPGEYFKRATITAAGDSNVLSVVKQNQLSVIEKGLVLQSLGASLDYVVGGGQIDLPYLSSAPAEFGAEDTTIADASWSAGAYTLKPEHIAASYDLAGTYVKSMSPDTVSRVMASLQNRILQGIERRAIERILSNASTSLAATSGTTFYEAVLALEKNIEFGSAYLFNKTTGERAKKAKEDAGSGRFVYSNSSVNGYRAATSSLFTGNTFIFGDFSHVNMVIYDSIEVSMMQDVTYKKKGNFALIADCFADANISNPVAFTKCTNAQTLGLNN